MYKTTFKVISGNSYNLKILRYLKIIIVKFSFMSVSIKILVLFKIEHTVHINFKFLI